MFTEKGSNMKTRKKFTREFKILVLREIENGKSSAQVSRENGIHPSTFMAGKFYDLDIIFIFITA